MTTYVLTGDWLCDQADIECDQPPFNPGPSVLCDGMGTLNFFQGDVTNDHISHTIDHPPVPPRARF